MEEKPTRKSELVQTLRAAVSVIRKGRMTVKLLKGRIPFRYTVWPDEEPFNRNKKRKKKSGYTLALEHSLESETWP